MRVLKLLFLLLLPAFASGQYVYVDYKFNRMVRFYEGSMFMEMAAPGTPPANFGHVYIKTDGRMYFKNDAGTEYLLTPGAGAGTVSSFTFTDGNGFDGTVTDATTTPTLSLTTTVTDNYIMLSNSGAISGDANLQYDGTTLSVSGTDAMTVNGSAITTNMAIHADGTATEAALEVHKHTATASAGAHIYGARSRGTGASPTAVSDNDHLLLLTAVGYDGTDYASSSQIVFEVDGTPGANDMPGQIVFLTAADGTQTLVEQMRIRPTGNIEMEAVVSEYNNIATANNGVAASVGTPVNLTGQTTDIVATTAYTADEDGFYQVCWNATITTAATTSSILGPFQVQFTNASDDVVKLFPTSAINFYNQTNANTTGAAIGGVMTVYAASGTAIQYLVGHTSSGATTMAFDINLTIIKL